MEASMTIIWGSTIGRVRAGATGKQRRGEQSKSDCSPFIQKIIGISTIPDEKNRIPGHRPVNPKGLEFCHFYLVDSGIFYG
jgi:hypothetical protein